MKLYNFDLGQPAPTVELIVGTVTIDLHNCCVLSGISVSANERTVILEWRVDYPTSGTADLPASSFQLVFEHTRCLRLEFHDHVGESILAHVARVVPGAGDYRMKETWRDGDDFQLLFEFENADVIEIGADLVRLEWRFRA